MGALDDILVVLLVAVRVLLVVGVIWVVVRELRKSGRVRRGNGRREG